MKHIEIIFFDFDGTLANTIPGIVNAVNVTLQHGGLPQRKPEEIVSFIGSGQDYLIERSVGDEHKDTYKAALDFFDTYYGAHLNDELSLYDGVKEGLASLHQVIKVIVSNKNESFIREGLEVLGIKACFSDILGGDNADCMKPDPCPLKNLLKKYQVHPGNALMVGDMNIDIQTGKNAGILTCGVTYGLGSRESLEKAGADYIVESLVELKQILS